MTGSVEKHGPSYRARWTDHNGKRCSKSGFLTKKDAAKFLRNKHREMELGVGVVDLTFDQAAAEYLAVSTSSMSRLRRIESGLSHFPHGSTLLRDLTPTMLSKWQVSLPEGNKRWDCTRCVKQVLNHAVRMGYLEKSPARMIRNPAPQAPESNPFASWEEVQRLDQYLDGLPTICVGTGMRPQEWRQLEWRHVDLEGRAIILPAHISKTGQARRIPLRQIVMDRLVRMDQATDLVLNVDNLQAWRQTEWKHALKQAGLEYRRPYEMRHTYATWALRAGVSTFLVARRMGTSVAQIDKTYGQFAVDTEEHELRLLDAYDHPVRGAVVDHFVPTEASV